jgi:hypothetical protein
MRRRGLGAANDQLGWRGVSRSARTLVSKTDSANGLGNRSGMNAGRGPAFVVGLRLHAHI